MPVHINDNITLYIDNNEFDFYPNISRVAMQQIWMSYGFVGAREYRWARFVRVYQNCVIFPLSYRPIGKAHEFRIIE